MITKKLFLLIFFTLISLFLFCNPSFGANDLALSAKASFLMDNKTGKVLYSNNENEKMYPASTTKILTAILVIENCNLNDVVTASYDAIMNIPEGYETANIQINEQLTIEQLLEMLLVRSSNDAANVLAEHVGGSISSFVSMMNTKVADLGLTDTHFSNAYGLHDENHYTTAHDLAYTMKYCLNNETFRKLAGKASCAIPATNLHEPRTYTSTNELFLQDSPYYYKYLMTGKTGFTTQAKECLVSSAFKDDLELIGIILGSDNRFEDAISLYDYGYSNYLIRPIVSAGTFATNINVSNGSYDTRNLNLLVENDISALMHSYLSLSGLDYDISLNKVILAPIEEGQVLGSITYTVDGVSYSSNLIASHSVKIGRFTIYAFFALAILMTLLVVLIVVFQRKSEK